MNSRRQWKPCGLGCWGLLGVASAHPGKRGPSPKLQRRLERLSRLPKAQQQTVLAMLDGVLLQHG